MKHEPPKKFAPQHRLIVIAAAQGKGPTEIAGMFGMGVAYVCSILNSPLFKLEVKRIQDQMQQETLGTFMDEVVNEARPTLARLRELRDQDDELPVALGAAREIWETVIPKRTRHEEDKTLRLVIEGGDLALLAKAIAEDDGVELEDATITQAAASTAPKLITPMMPEELEE